jgi:hypothetical protein
VRLAFASLLTGLVIFLAASGGAGADETTPCPADYPQPTLSVVDPTGAGTLYATHLLRASLEFTGDGSADVRSFTAPGARIFTEDDLNRPTLVSDTPGQLTLTAVVVIRDTDRLPYQDDYSCTTTVATTVALQPPAPSVFRDFRRPHYVVPARKLYHRRPDFSFNGQGGEGRRRPLAVHVRARGSSRLKLPGAGVKAASHDYPLREFEFPEGEESRECELLCSPVNGRGFRKRVEVFAERLGGRGTGGLKITVVTPVGLHF